ncbi:MAG: 4-hydroxybutyrate CoA-transferase [Firmicutes bacterium]|nr:4-hydroxybutyrate CoA-transferase [Bacillota bacterium]MCM1401466.1 4-hydroxybutyrate CoA-transferase [Bacteroides sp.]MCM1476824.1 4-hydroxybutyrate CoA-transferase [Bacteroides sp.]
MTKVKFTTAAEAVKVIRSGHHVFVQGSTSIPETLVSALADRAGELENVRIYNAFALARRVSPLCDERCRDSFLIDSFFVSNAVRGWVNKGFATSTPRSLGEIPELFRDGTIRLDVAMINCSLPDVNGYVSYGISSDLTPSAVESAKIVIAQINSHVPFAWGDAVIHLSDLDYAVMTDCPLAETPASESTEKELQIANHIAPLIPDGATLQIGVGGIPNAILHALTDHKHLGVHSEAMTDGVVPLIEAGVIDNSRKKVKPGVAVASLAIGTRKLYDFMHRNSKMSFHDVAWVNDPFVIAQNPCVVSVNSCLEIDLTGQVCADSLGTYLYSGSGGQPDFVYGSSRSSGGQSFLAMQATTSSGKNKIKPTLSAGAGVVTTRARIHWVVTEHGAVNLRGKNLIERARLLISVAAPQFREELDREAYARFGYAYRKWK